MEFYGTREIDSRRRSGETSVFPRSELPLVSIVIPLHNKSGYTYCCLRSILAHTTHLAYEVVAVDDASTDTTPALLALAENIRVVRHSSNIAALQSLSKCAAHYWFLNISRVM